MKNEVKLKITRDNRRIFYVEVGDLPKHKIQEAIAKLKGSGTWQQ